MKIDKYLDNLKQKEGRINIQAHDRLINKQITVYEKLKREAKKSRLIKIENENIKLKKVKINPEKESITMLITFDII